MTWGSFGAWVDSRLLPLLLCILLAGDTAAGLNWLLTPPADLTSPAYDIAQRYVAVSTLGTCLLVLTATSLGSMLGAGKRWITGYTFCLLSGYWVAWAVLFTMGTWGLDDGASAYNSITAAVLFLLHLLAGAAVAYRPGVHLPVGG